MWEMKGDMEEGIGGRGGIGKMATMGTGRGQVQAFPGISHPGALCKEVENVHKAKAGAAGLNGKHIVQGRKPTSTGGRREGNGIG
jgi:hypothetical protein